MADRLHAGLAHLITCVSAEDPPASLDDLSDGQFLMHAADALGKDAGWAGLELPYPGFEAPSGKARARPPRCSVVLAPREVAKTDEVPGLFSDATSTPEEACWVELVLAREWRQLERCPRYAAQFTDRAMRMVAQLATDERIDHVLKTLDMVIAWVRGIELVQSRYIEAAQAPRDGAKLEVKQEPAT